MTNIAEVEGVGPAYAAKLKEAGVGTVEQLLEKGASVKGRKDLVDATGISAALILKWVNRADLARVKGIGEEYADLLEAAGVDTVVELATRVPANLHARLVEINTAKKLVRQLPGESVVSGWVEHAKTLPRVVSY